MHKVLFDRTVKWVFAAVLMGAMGGGAKAGSFTRECAIRDLQVLMLIEERESASAVSGEDFYDATSAMLRAQIACYEGRITDALALYDEISHKMAAHNVFGRR